MHSYKPRTFVCSIKRKKSVSLVNYGALASHHSSIDCKLHLWLLLLRGLLFKTTYADSDAHIIGEKFWYSIKMMNEWGTGTIYKSTKLYKWMNELEIILFLQLFASPA